MYDKHLLTLEFHKVLDRLAAHASFSAGEELARALRPASDLREVREQIETTSEARALLESRPDTTLGGAHDVRPLARAALRSVLLSPVELLDVRDTLIAARTLHRALTRSEGQFPRLADVAGRIQPCPDVVAEIDRCLDARGEVRDDASLELARIRREERIAHDRIQDKLQGIIASPANAPYLQEPIITQRDGRYVIPVKADFKGRIRGIVHDVSASGATLFVEPLSVVDLNNAWRELQLKEQQEVERILAALSALVAKHSVEIEQTVEALAELDLVFAKARYAEAIDASPPEIVPFRKDAPDNHPGSVLHFIAARHPLLDPQRVTPIDVVFDEATHILIITGPNTGGKTVSLKTIGLLTVMAQAGLHIPAQAGSRLSPFENVYADIGDEQSIEQNLSTFSAHLTNILSFLDQADERSLVLLDELGAGTDPAEGAALARAMLDHFRQRRVTAFVATHYPELKTYAQLTPGVCNACVEFDPQTLSPTYRLTVGLPGRSNAFAIARRLGMPEKIVKAAQQMVSPDSLRTEDMLSDIHQLRIQAAQARDEAAAARATADKLTRELRARLDGIEGERQAILEQAHAEAAAELESLRAETRALRRRLQAAAAPLEAVVAIEESSKAMESQLEAAQPSPTPPPTPPTAGARPIRPGDTVWVHPLHTRGQVLEIHGEEAEVKVGPARTRLGLAALELHTPPPEELPASPPTPSVRAAPSPGARLDLRGCTVDEALGRLDHHLDAAVRAELPWIHIIHGKGTGALRQAVRSFLDAHSAVVSYASAGDKEGGDGVTVVTLAS